ncbi:gliding motility lipoprotein GldD [Tenacibaculum amylolyticum]|uniref:gliding motility lipoprotein GldD n=1 Tax=Tenacibaculum amylolyticum TaxID=104269 RepID=UPI0038937D8D
MRRFFLIVIVLSIVGCGGDVIPKPKAYLSLQYPTKEYKEITVDRPYSFEVPTTVKVQEQPKNWLKIKYPLLKASVDITYRPVQNNLKELLLEADKLVFEHTIKADNIVCLDYSNEEKKAYGKLCEILGNAASQVQFHVTDSTKHFLKASLFFYTKPNYDSILPAVDYIKKDMIRMMETLEWKE